MQLFQDPSPAAWARIAYASIRDTLSVLNYKNKIGGDGWIRTTALFRGEIYSLVQSTTLPRLQKKSKGKVAEPSVPLLREVLRRYALTKWYTVRESNPSYIRERHVS